MTDKVLPTIENHIDGNWTPARSGQTVEARSPGSGAILAQVASSDRIDAQDAIAAAQRGYATSPKFAQRTCL